MEIQERIKMMGLIPVVVIDNAQDAVPLANALCGGRLPCAEITFRTEAAEQSIRAIRTSFPDMLVGAGTVLTAAQVDRACDAGAQFIVSPGLNPQTVEYCLKKNIPIFPGISSASDIEIALSLGITTVKFFPAEQAGGLPLIQALASPFPQIRFIPTGGITRTNLAAYLSYEKVIGCGGSWLVKSDMIRAQRFDDIRAAADDACNIVAACRSGKTKP
ncbi:MAG: bifunctional 4-hydroxy-2-oxoglutarate aldolase/2-dehydro-3-deoxy-phosphogluconate aldolase [Treponema sp.]|nr:bifunctional 4-hydroxy-2-oxoglutarate aldolase/2-dehydro-3-deoxy-phosphogluconate aldolase [Treponema sp.]